MISLGLNIVIQLAWAHLAHACSEPANPLPDNFHIPRHTIRQTEEGLPTNFQFHGFSDAAILSTAKQGAIDMLQLVNTALAAADTTSTSFLRYFQPDDLDIVLQTFDKIVAESALVVGTDAHIVDFYFDTWDKLPPQTTKCSAKKALLAVTVEGIAHPQDKNIVLCAELFKNKNARNLADISCESLPKSATWVSMDTIGSSILHEMLHLESLLGRSVDDVQVNIDGKGTYITGYGPYGAMMVNQIDQLGILNADNYVWFAMEAWFMDECNLTGFNDPPKEIITFEL